MCHRYELLLKSSLQQSSQFLAEFSDRYFLLLGINYWESEVLRCLKVAASRSYAWQQEQPARWWKVPQTAAWAWLPFSSLVRSEDVFS